MLKLLLLTSLIIIETLAVPDRDGPPPGMPGGHFDAKLEDQENAEEIKNKAIETCVNLLHDDRNHRPPVNRLCTSPGITKVENFKTQVVAGTNYIMDLTVQWDDKCGGQKFVCKKLMLHEPLPNRCNKDVCLEHINKDQVTLLDISGMPGGHFPAELERQENADEIKVKAVESCLNLLHDDETHKPPVSRLCTTPEIDNIENFKTQVVSGTNYIMDLTVKWNKDCGGQVFVCKKLMIHEPLPSRCTNCLENINKDQVTLLDISRAGGNVNAGLIMAPQTFVILICAFLFA